MKILAISDEECPYLWDYYQPGRLKGYDMILSCGDLKADYLSFLATFASGPVYYVHGNHDGRYAQKPPEGCLCLEDKVVNVNGVRILGLGGSPMYSGGPHQYTEKQMRMRIWKLKFQLWRSKGVDIVLTHAPVRNHGDADDPAHRGFEAFWPLLDKYKPKYLVHGHVHMRYGADIPRTVQYGETTLVNACERYVLEI